MLKEQLLKNKERLENEGRLKISSYHVLSTLPRNVLSTHGLLPESFGYFHGRSRKGRAVSSLSRKTARDTWLLAAAEKCYGKFRCEICGASRLESVHRSILFINEWPKWCGVRCARRHPDLQKIRRANSESRYGEPYEVTQARRLKSYQSPEGTRRGVRARNATLAEKFGSLPAFYAHLAEARKATWIKKYGVDNPSKSAEVFSRQNSYRVTSVRISGKTFKVQGYEAG